MDTLAFTVNTTPIDLPPQITRLNLAFGELGGNAWGFVVNVAFVAASVLALAYLLWGGIQWIMSEGEAKKIEKARNTMLFALIGMAIVFLSYLAISVIGYVFGQQFFSPVR